jgi:hypothetical protein
MFGPNAPRYAQPRPYIGPTEITKSQNAVAHLPIANHAHEAKAPHDKSYPELMGMQAVTIAPVYSMIVREYLRGDGSGEGPLKAKLSALLKVGSGMAASKAYGQDMAAYLRRLGYQQQHGRA